MDSTFKELEQLLGPEKFDTFEALHGEISARYEMETFWTDGGKAWDRIFKYRRGGKTLCALCVRACELGCLIVLGKAEREKFDAQRENFSDAICSEYDETKTYHDGKWLMLTVANRDLFADIVQLLAIKRRPNR